jgi:predicted homoserine dehydrogenase-like protein
MKRKINDAKNSLNKLSNNVKILLFGAALLIGGYALMTDFLMFPGLLVVMLFALNQQRVIKALNVQIDEQKSIVTKKEQRINQVTEEKTKVSNKALSSTRFVELVEEALNLANTGATVLCKGSEIIFMSKRTGKIKVMTIDGINDKSEYRAGLRMVSTSDDRMPEEPPVPTL